MTMLEACLSPGDFIYVPLTKQAISDHQVEFDAFSGKESSTGVDIANFFFTYCSIP